MPSTEEGPAGHTFSTVPLDRSEVYYTNCPVVSASNVDEALGWTRAEFKKVGVTYAYLRSRRENDWYPHYIHNMDNLIRVGGMFPAVDVHADMRRTKLLGATHVYEGGCMLVRARDDIYRMQDLRGKKIGLSKSLNTIKTDWWRATEEQGIELMLRLNGMSREDVEIVEFEYPDDWYGNPAMLEPMETPPSCGSPATTSTTGPCDPWNRPSRAVWSTRSTPRASASSTFRRPPARSR